MTGRPLTTPRLWFYMDSLFTKQPVNVALRGKFGGAGPYALVTLLCEAYVRFFLRGEAGVVDMTYGDLAHESGLKDHWEALAVLRYLEREGVVQLDGCAFPDEFEDEFGSATFRVRLLKFSSWTPTSMVDPTNAERQARNRAKSAATEESDRSGNATFKSDSTVTVDIDVDIEDKGKAGKARPEVLRLSTLLADLIRKRDPKAKVAPSSKRWLDAIRLLLDADERSEAEVEHVIRWCQGDTRFWAKNILSAPKLREKFDQLYAQAGKPKGNADDFFKRNGM